LLLAGIVDELEFHLTHDTSQNKNLCKLKCKAAQINQISLMIIRFSPDSKTSLILAPK
jgi:hypothetical protein